jgi:hypothetical protein
LAIYVSICKVESNGVNLRIKIHWFALEMLDWEGKIQKQSHKEVTQ